MSASGPTNPVVLGAFNHLICTRFLSYNPDFSKKKFKKKGKIGKNKIKYLLAIVAHVELFELLDYKKECN